MTRSFDRTPLAVPVSFAWWDDEGNPHQGSGYTRDLSPYSAFVLCDSYPPPGAKVRFYLTLPCARPHLRHWHMEAEGYVVRVDAGSGFAAISDGADAGVLDKGERP